MAACGALIFDEVVNSDGATVLRASTGGGAADLSPAAASTLGAALLDWARSQAMAAGCTAGGDCPRHPNVGGVHDPALTDWRVSS